MLMPEHLVALNDVVVTCRDAARQYDADIDRLSNADLATLFGALVEERERFARELSAQVRDFGGLPREPDVELEQVQQLVSRFRASLSLDERLTILDDRLENEHAIEAAVAHARQFQWPRATATCLDGVREAVERAAERLRAFRQSLAAQQE